LAGSTRTRAPTRAALTGSAIPSPSRTGHPIRCRNPQAPRHRRRRSIHWGRWSGWRPRPTSGDPTAIRDSALAAAIGHRAADQPDAAIEACYLGLGLTPDDAGLHLALAELYLDRGWRTLAVDKLVLLARLADLADDPVTRARLCDVARTHLADEPRLTALCE